MLRTNNRLETTVFFFKENKTNKTQLYGREMTEFYPEDLHFLVDISPFSERVEMMASTKLL